MQVCYVSFKQGSQESSSATTRPWAKPISLTDHPFIELDIPKPGRLVGSEAGITENHVRVNVNHMDEFDERKQAFWTSVPFYEDVPALQQLNSLAYANQVAGTNDSSLHNRVVSVGGAYQGLHFGIKEGIERIISAELVELSKEESPTTSDHHYQLAHRINDRVQQLIPSPEFYKQQEFLEFMLPAHLKEYADSLPLKKRPIVIDCGHINSEGYVATDIDIQTVIDGALLFQYLRSKGHEDVKLSFLVNDIYLHDQTEKKEARRISKHLRQKGKRDGVNQIIATNYGHVLTGFGITPDMWVDVVDCYLERGIKFAAKDDLDKHEKGENSPIDPEVEFNPYRGGLTYSIPSNPLGRGPGSVFVASEDTGAPSCPIISAKYLRRQGGDAEVIALRDRSERKGVVCGARIAPAVYGFKGTQKAFLYDTGGNSIGIVEIIPQDTSPTTN